MTTETKDTLTLVDHLADMICNLPVGDTTTEMAELIGCLREQIAEKAKLTVILIARFRTSEAGRGAYAGFVGEKSLNWQGLMRKEDIPSHLFKTVGETGSGPYLIKHFLFSPTVDRHRFDCRSLSAFVQLMELEMRKVEIRESEGDYVDSENSSEAWRQAIEQIKAAAN